MRISTALLTTLISHPIVRAYSNSAEYRIPFSLKGITIADPFVERVGEMKRLEDFFNPTAPAS